MGLTRKQPPAQRKAPENRWNRWARYGGWAFGASLLLLLAFLGAIELAIWHVADQLPPIHDARSFEDTVCQVSRVLASDKTVLAEYYVERRTVVSMESISPLLVQAVTAVEDKQFRTHEGVSPVTIIKALISDALAGKMVRGGSTLTQQLAKNLYLTHEKTLERKVKEAAIARQLEARLTKDQILWQYLNLIYWGHGNFGVQEAARFYFGVDASDLNLPQAALLAGIIRSPERLSPVKHPDKAATRLSVALNEMAEMGFLSPDSGTFAMPPILGQRDVATELSPYGVDAALVQLRPVIDSQLLHSAGLRIFTTIEPDVQVALNDSLAALLPSLGISTSWREQAPERICDCWKTGRLLPGCTAWARLIRVEPDGQLTVDLLGVPATIPADALAPPPLDPGWAADMKPGRWLHVMPNQEILAANPFVSEDVTAVPILEPQVAALVVEANSGRILGVLGGLDFAYHPFNRALPSPSRTTPADVALHLIHREASAKTPSTLTVVEQVVNHRGVALFVPPLLSSDSSVPGQNSPLHLHDRNWFTHQNDGLLVVVWCGDETSDCAQRLGQDILLRLERLGNHMPQGNGPK